MSNSEKKRLHLRTIMAANDLSIDEVCEITTRSYSTVSKWVSISGYEVPTECIDALEKHVQKKITIRAK